MLLDRIKIFADGASLPSMLEAAGDPRIGGFTTNPTLMRKAGVTDYRAFAHQVLAEIKDKPISFEVFADDFPEMRRQAREIATWGENVYVKIPITNTRRETATPLVRELGAAGIKLNVTAICTVDQVRETAQALGVHTNTVYFRLNRLKKISDLDPRSYAGTSAILTALRLLEIQAAAKAS